MILRLAFLLILLFHPENSAIAQTIKIPRDFSKLVARAQDFWTAMGANQRLKALEFVLPEKKEFLLSTGGMPFTDPQIIGVDFTGDVNRASVRVSVKAISQAAPAGRLSWIVSDTWLWVRNNWFVDLQNPLTDTNPFITSQKIPAQPDALLAEAESRFKVLDELIDVGTVPQGDLHRIPVRVEYTGEAPIFITSELALEILGVEANSAQHLTAQSKEFGLLLNTEAWTGPFLIPYPLKVHYKGVTVNRTVVVRGNVFTPLSVTQRPLPFTNTPGQEVTLVIRNNTSDSISIVSVGSAAIFNVVFLPETISPGGEGELILRLNPNAQADLNHQIRLNLSRPFLGKEDYYLTLRVRPTP